MPTMATTAIASCIFSAEIVLSIITLSINGVVLNSLVHNRKVKSKHFNMLLVKMTFDSSFLLGTIVYSGSVLLNLADIFKNVYLTFFSGAVVECFETSAALLHLLVSVDRLCALKKPMEYESVSQKLQKVALGSIVISFTILYALNAFTGHTTRKHGHLFAHFVDGRVESVVRIITLIVFAVSLVVSTMFLREYRRHMMNMVGADSTDLSHNVRKVDVHIVTFCVFLLSLLASVKFSVEYKRYLNTRVVSTTATDVNKVKKINRVVLHLLVSEFLLLIVPNTVEIVLKKIFDGNEVHRYGPINHPLIVVYTTLSAIVFCAIFPKK
ncbi:hypothetical protein QR680_010135 [Steinernema hermaphroditum]|uniref:G-protein coupled receptors family 1 profile domain-containing protein n=1 Tax=Steinernema hermaphroditum TaxID=289476 RepID=A0AA39IMW1_9BILA|nr:hypothetical protein QR680_010135 [Steinernema hermaphroditum]